MKKTNDNSHNTQDKGGMSFNVKITYETGPFTAPLCLQTFRCSALLNNENIRGLESPSLSWTAEMPYASTLYASHG